MVQSHFGTERPAFPVANKLTIVTTIVKHALKRIQHFGMGPPVLKAAVKCLMTNMYAQHVKK